MIGTLPSQEIRKLVRHNRIETLGNMIGEDQIQPASLDLRLGQTIYAVPAASLPLSDCGMENALDTKRGVLLRKGHVYVAECQEYVSSLPYGLSGRANAKSTSGRLGLACRLLAAGCSRYDYIPKEYSGPLVLEICPQVFDITVYYGDSLAQVRFCAGPWHSKRTIVGVDLVGNGGVVGYASRHRQVDFRESHYAPDWWNSFSSSETVILYPGKLYIFASKETVAVDPLEAAEMIPFDASLGEFRAHYAGFFDPGFCAKAVFEVMPRDMPIMLRDGQQLATLRYEHMSEVPDKLYGGANNHYQGQALKLAKQFI